MLSILLPGFFYLLTLKTKKTQIYFIWKSNSKPTQGIGIWISLQASDLLAFAADPILISILLTSNDVAKYAVYQKLLILGTAITTSLAPLQSLTNSIRFGSSNNHKLHRFNVGFSTFVIMGMLLIAPKAISFISGGKFHFEWSIFFALCLNALIGASTSQLIQSSNLGDRLKIRVKASILSTILGLTASIILLPILGISATFYSSALSLLAYFVYIKMWVRRHEN